MKNNNNERSGTGLKDDILSLPDLVARSGAGISEIEAWAAAKLIRPLGYADDVWIAHQLGLMPGSNCGNFLFFRAAQNR